MRAFLLRGLKTAVVTSACVTLLFGCGSSTNNDQGVVATLLGFFSAAPDDPCDVVPPGVSGVIASLSAPTGEVLGTSSGIRLYVGVSNALQGQTLRVQSVSIDYEIPGASKQPPSTALPLSMLLGPANEELGVPDNSSFPAGAFGTNLCNRSYAETFLVPASILEWINFNRSALPEPPFLMSVTVGASAISSAGDRFYTNEETVFVEFTPDNVIPPTDGSDSSSVVATDESVVATEEE